MEYSASDDGTYILTCTSMGSPPTTVSWTRNQINLATSGSEGKYTFSKKVIDKPSTTYDNVLTIKGIYEDAVGDYKCTITNSIGEATAEKTVNGMHIKCGQYSYP